MRASAADDIPKDAVIKAQTDLQPLLPLLTAFTHRNKNQHRASHWWSHLNILRRFLRDFCGAKHSSGLSRRVQRLQNVIMPRCYLKFSQLAADNQHATLGLMLLTVLARANTVVKELLPTESVADIESLQRTRVQNHGPDVTETEAVLDKGVLVARITTEHLPVSTRSKSPADPSMNPTQRGQRQRQSEGPRKMGQDEKKKKRKKGNDELSSLFGSLM